jgi:uncharacterized protein
MSQKIVNELMASFFRHNKNGAGFTWHGGEPLLAGMDFFENLVKSQNLNNTKNLKVTNSVTTNGLLLNDTWASFFVANNFSVGVSIDGPYDLNFKTRNTPADKFKKILEGIDSLVRYGVKFGIICVVCKESVGKEREIFDFYNSLGIEDLAFLPCFLLNNDQSINTKLSISAKEYGKFLVSFFDIWTQSGVKGIDIRNFNEALRFKSNLPNLFCENRSECHQHLTISPDGKVYMCDNFAHTKDNVVGKVGDNFSNFESSSRFMELKRASCDLPDSCKNCKYVSGCLGGCKYHRWVNSRDFSRPQVYCYSKKLLYSHIDKVFDSLGIEAMI